MSEIIHGIETCINHRWENGVDHHPESENIIRTLSRLDAAALGCTLDISYGGDGDNGETMMYLLDIMFEARDKGVDVNLIIDELRKR